MLNIFPLSARKNDEFFGSDLVVTEFFEDCFALEKNIIDVARLSMHTLHAQHRL